MRLRDEEDPGKMERDGKRREERRPTLRVGDGILPERFYRLGFQNSRLGRDAMLGKQINRELLGAMKLSVERLEMLAEARVQIESVLKSDADIMAKVELWDGWEVDLQKATDDLRAQLDKFAKFGT